jgi:hypothetical protein
VVSHYCTEEGDSMSWQNDGPELVGPESGDTVTLASDADRDAAVRVLNEGFAEGRLTADEHGERVRAAYAGRTWRELARLTADLPGPARAAGPAVIGEMPYGLDWCLLCALLILCPPAAIAWLLAARRRSAAGQWHAVTAGGGRAVFAAPAAVPAGDGWRAEDR